MFNSSSEFVVLLNVALSGWHFLGGNGFFFRSSSLLRVGFFVMIRVLFRIHDLLIDMLIILVFHYVYDFIVQLLLTLLIFLFF